MTVEDAVVVAIKLIFGKSSEESGAIIDILLETALGISAVDLENISLLEVYMSYLRQAYKDKERKGRNGQQAY